MRDLWLQDRHIAHVAVEHRRALPDWAQTGRDGDFKGDVADREAGGDGAGRVSFRSAQSLMTKFVTLIKKFRGPSSVSQDLQ